MAHSQRHDASPELPSGLFGKLPGRRDFVRAGLPRSFTDAWDDWMSGVVAGSRSAMGDAWREAWMEAPVWRFALPGGMCGKRAVLGLWMPSTDRVGRLFPLMLATCCLDETPEAMARAGTAWLDAAEEAGRAALSDALGPVAVLARLAATPGASSGPLPHDLSPRPNAGLWWTAGSPRVPAQGMALDHMPGTATFVAMLDAHCIVAEEAR